MIAVRAKAARLDDAKELASLDEKLTKDGQKMQSELSTCAGCDPYENAKNREDFPAHLDEMKKILTAGPLQQGDDEAAMLAASASQRMADKLGRETYDSLAEILATEPKFARMSSSCRLPHAA